MRRLKPDPVPAELIRKILEAGVSAPSGGNMQRWRFLVIRDPIPCPKGKVRELCKKSLMQSDRVGINPDNRCMLFVLINCGCSRLFRDFQVRLTADKNQVFRQATFGVGFC